MVLDCGSPGAVKHPTLNQVNVTKLYKLPMAHYQLVEKHAIEHHNEYYEVRPTQTDNEPKSLFFTTNEENLEEVAAAIVSEHMPGVKHWAVIPHRKDS